MALVKPWLKFLELSPESHKTWAVSSQEESDLLSMLKS